MKGAPVLQGFECRVRVPCSARSTFLVSENIGWARRLSVAADAKGIIGHAGAVLLRACADQTGLTGALSGALRVRGRSPGWDRGAVLVQLAVAIDADQHQSVPTTKGADDAQG